MEMAAARGWAMKPTTELREDHAILRAKLNLLEGLLPLARTTQFPIRDLVYSISRRLRCHTEKEEVLLAALRDVRHPGWAAGPVNRLPDEHHDQRQTLDILEHLLAQGSACPSDQVMAYGSHLLDGLREHMAAEEETLFPMVDRIVDTPHEKEVTHHMHDIAQRYYPEGEPRMTAGRRLPIITQEMTVNHVLRAHPDTRAIFEAFHVDCEMDGLSCLDELYWRRGADLQALLQALNQAAGTPHTFFSAH